jgi:hypothetical protein
MTSILARLALLAALMPIPAMAEERENIPGTQQTFGHWQLSAWKEGARSGCTMTVGYRSGVEMSFVLEGDQWRATWWHASWRYVEGQTITVTYWVDSLPPQSVNAEAIAGAQGATMLRAVLPDNPELFDQFRLGAELRIRVQGGVSHTFKLTATNAALAALRSCAAKYKGTAPSPVTAAAGPPREGLPMQALPALTADQRVDAVRLAANLLTKMPGFRILNEGEQKALAPIVAGMKAAVVWRSGEVYGLLHLFPKETEAGVPKLAAGLAFGSSQQCNGELTLTIAPDVRSATTRRIQSACVEGSSKTVMRMIVMPFGKDGVYLFVTAGSPEDSAAVGRAEDLLRNALFEIVQR